jgi:hypothetical protein
MFPPKGVTMKISNNNIQFSAPPREPRQTGKKRMVVLGLCLAAGAVTIVVGKEGLANVLKKPSQTSVDVLSYGSRAGMNVTITSKEGIGSIRSVITATQTELDARAYCSEYVQDMSPGCVKQQLKDTSLAKTITANCVSGEFTNFFGEKYRFVSVTHTGGIFGTPQNVTTGQLLDESAASGLSHNMQQFDALCPGVRAADVKSPAKASKSTSLPTAGRLVQARRSGVLPGAIICPDLELIILMQAQFARHWEETNQDKATGGQSALIRGRAAPYPDFAAFGCAVLPSGASMTLEIDRPIPIVSARLSNGNNIRGVTFGYMYGNGKSPSPF